MNDPHYELLMSELYVSKTEQDSDVFVANVERLLGHKLESSDHPQHAHLSIDDAYDAFFDGVTPEMYASETSKQALIDVDRYQLERQ